MEVLSRIEEQLGRFGVAGHVELDGALLQLTGHGPDIAVVVEGLEGWRELDPSSQARLIDRVVRELVSRRRAGIPRMQRGPEGLEWLRLGAAIALLGTGIGGAWYWLGKPAHEATTVTGRPESSPSQRELPRAASAERASSDPPPAALGADACLRVQRRVATGGSVTALDADGWVVELMLLSDRPGLDPASPALDTFLSKLEQPGSTRRLIWSEDKELAASAREGSFAMLSQPQWADVLPGVVSGLRIAWTGQYVSMYFDDAARVKLQRLSAAMYEATGAAYGALYAHCRSGEIYQIGSWFRGRELTAAAVALVAAMGLHAQVVHVAQADPKTTSRSEQQRVWERLAQRIRRFNRDSLALVLAEDGGMVASRPGAWSTITFPFPDANRATRSSLRIASVLGFAPKR